VSAAADTSALVGGPVIRYGGKGRTAHLLVPHFARMPIYAEPFFGGGSVFFKLPPGTYSREAVNDLDASLVTFFRVLRDRADELVRVCEDTPNARDEFSACLARAEDELEEARRVWVRARQGFAGKARTIGDWGRCPGNVGHWQPSQIETKLAALRRYAARLRGVAIDSIDGVEFVAKWGQADTFVYADPPYAPEARTGEDYAHEMTADDHRRLAAALHGAVARGAHVAVSGYPSKLYDEELFPTWRRVTFDVPLLGTRDATGQRRTEVLWMSYPVERELQWRGPERQLSLLGSDGGAP